MNRPEKNSSFECIINMEQPIQLGIKPRIKEFIFDPSKFFAICT